MCAPVVGAISAASGIASAVGGYQSQSAAAAAQNKAAINNYEYQIQQRENNWRQTLTSWDHKKLEYKKNTQENFRAAAKGYAQGQQRLNEIYAKAKFTNQDQLNKILASQGANYAAGQTGKSAQRSNAMMLSALGRSQAQTAESLASARLNTDTANQNIRDELYSANRKAFSNVALRPVAGIAPPPPVLQSGPNPLSLIGGIGSAIAGGISTYNSLKARPTDLPDPDPDPNPPTPGQGFGYQIPTQNIQFQAPGVMTAGNSYDFFGQTNPLI